MKNKTLPIKLNEKVAVFGRIQNSYYKSGTGSGGLVNVDYVVSILDGLRNSKVAVVDEKLADIYQQWVNDHPFEKGAGWGQEPWSQVEMEISDEVVSKAASENDVAVVIVGRTAGEDQDARNEPGSYLLTELEEKLIEQVSNHFPRCAVVLNVGNIIDMKWVEKYQVPSVMYVWQGGMEGGNAVADVLTGKVNPCGKLSNTISIDLDDVFSTRNFGRKDFNIYQEDIMSDTGILKLSLRTVCYILLDSVCLILSLNWKLSIHNLMEAISISMFQLPIKVPLSEKKSCRCIMVLQWVVWVIR
jgi:beta-glucosidase